MTNLDVTIKTALQSVVGENEIALEVPVQAEHGDFSSNIALITAKSQGKKPRELAEEIVAKLQKDKKLSEIVDKIEIAGPGFINFFLSKEALIDTLRDAGSYKDIAKTNNSKKNIKIMFEYGQPNTHKLPHIGHLFSYIYGESMTRLLEAVGNTVRRVNYQGDVGPHVSKCLWAFQKEEPTVPDSLEEKVALLQKMYQIGSKAYKEDEASKKEIDDLNKKIYEKDQSILETWKQTREWSTSYYKDFEKRLSVNYDRYYYESEVFQKGIETVKANLGSVFQESEGAIIFEGSKYGLHDRVFVTGIGTATYEAKDLALEKLKIEEWPADLLVITTAHEQNEYFKVVFKALEILEPSFADKLKHVGFGMVQLKSGKMSSRTGNIVGAVELVDLVVGEVAKILHSRKELTDHQRVDIAEKVGVGAIKYSFLKSNPLQDVKFDLEESVSIEGNSGPYLQYTFTRTQSVLKKAGGEKGGGKWVVGSGKLSAEALGAVDFNAEELALMRTFVHFHGVIFDAAKNYSPNLLATYLYDVAQKYNSFYNQHRILESSGTELELRLELTAATGQILKNGLKLLGIEAPEKM